MYTPYATPLMTLLAEFTDKRGPNVHLGAVIGRFYAEIINFWLNLSTLG